MHTHTESSRCICTANCSSLLNAADAECQTREALAVTANRVPLKAIGALACELDSGRERLLFAFWYLQNAHNLALYRLREILIHWRHSHSISLLAYGNFFCRNRLETFGDFLSSETASSSSFRFERRKTVMNHNSRLIKRESFLASRFPLVNRTSHLFWISTCLMGLQTDFSPKFGSST